MLCAKFIGTGLLLTAAPLSALFGGHGPAAAGLGYLGWTAGALALGADALLTGLLFSPKLREWLGRR